MQLERIGKILHLVQKLRPQQQHALDCSTEWFALAPSAPVGTAYHGPVSGVLVVLLCSVQHLGNKHMCSLVPRCQFQVAVEARGSYGWVHACLTY